MMLGDTNNTRMDKVCSYVYKNYRRMEEHAPKLNNTDIFPLESHQVPNLTEDDEVVQDSLALG